MEVVTLLPLSQAEMMRRETCFAEQVFSGSLPKPDTQGLGGNLMQRVLAGGYPEMVRRQEPARRRVWAREYLNAVVRRDARDVASLDKLDQLPRLLRALAHHAGQLCNFTQLGEQIGLDDKSTRKYLGALEQLFLVHRLEPWHSNRLSRLIKTPKLHFLDSGLLASLIGATPARMAESRDLMGPLLETFVFGEVLKALAASPAAITLAHYRDKDQNEVDIVMENEAGNIVGLEVKASATVRTADFAGLRRLANATGKHFRLGVILHDSDSIVGFGNGLFAAPVASLWGQNVHEDTRHP